MSRIFARSPFYITISGSPNDETEIELRLWNGTGSAPTNPTYTLSKPIPSTLIGECNYNISPYIREYITHTSFANVYNVNNAATPTNEWCNVQVKRIRNNSVLTTDTYKAYDGWGFYSDGYNDDLGFTLLAEDTYYYWYDPNATLSIDLLKRAGSITLEATNGWDVFYTNLRTNATFELSLTTTRVQDVYRVYPLYMEDGNKVEIRNASNVVQKTFYFRPIQECKYEPVTIDYINRYGGWSREFMFKASRENFEVEKTDYHLMQTINYDTNKGQFGRFNVNGKQNISVNTGWVDEGFSERVREMMMSERILVNGEPAQMRSTSTQLFKHINEKLINYQLEFDYAYYINNNV